MYLGRHYQKKNKWIAAINRYKIVIDDYDETNSDLKINMKVIQNVDQKNQVTSIWEYDDEKHMKKLRNYLSHY